MTKVLVLGGSGLLGSSISRILGYNFEVIKTYNKNPDQSKSKSTYLDVSVPGMFEEIIKKFSPQFVINCIGDTSVEDCELFPEKAMLLNAIFPYQVSKASRNFNFQLIHISTDHFSAHINEIRDELMHPIPLNSYGFSKLTGESLVLNENPESLILRTNFFGVSPRGNHSLLDFAISALTNNTRILGFEDVWFTPLGASQIGNFLAWALKSNHSGILNLSGTEAVTKYQFLTEVAKALECDPNLVTASNSSKFATSVARPSNLTLDNSKLLGLGFKLPALKDMIREELSYRVIA